MALQMKDACERCKSALGERDEALICSYECTFCPDCGKEMELRCPNCGGELVARPKRPRKTAAA